MTTTGLATIARSVIRWTVSGYQVWSTNWVRSSLSPSDARAIRHTRATVLNANLFHATTLYASHSVKNMMRHFASAWYSRAKIKHTSRRLFTQEHSQSPLRNNGGLGATYPCTNAVDMEPLSASQLKVIHQSTCYYHQDLYCCKLWPRSREGRQRVAAHHSTRQSMETPEHL